MLSFSSIFLKLNLVRWFQVKLEKVEIHNAKLARFLCRLIPAQCPFERDLKIGDHTIFHIPPLCKINPLYYQLISLRFKSLSYLVDQCGEDITTYC
jgi:hypothetical protein